jgi:hypothetical protein
MRLQRQGISKKSRKPYKGLGRIDHPPSIIITSQINLLKFQGEIKAITKGSFNIRNTKNGTGVIVISSHKNLLEKTKVLYYTFHLKSVKTIKAVIRYLPGSTPAEVIANEMLVLGFKVISVRQMTSTRPQAPANLSLFLATLPRNEKSQEISKLTSLSHDII